MVQRWPVRPNMDDPAVELMERAAYQQTQHEGRNFSPLHASIALLSHERKPKGPRKDQTLM